MNNKFLIISHNIHLYAKFCAVFIASFQDIITFVQKWKSLNISRIRGTKFGWNEKDISLNSYKESFSWNRVQIIIGCKFFISLFSASNSQLFSKKI